MLVDTLLRTFVACNAARPGPQRLCDTSTRRVASVHGVRGEQVLRGSQTQHAMITAHISRVWVVFGCLGFSIFFRCKFGLVQSVFFVLMVKGDSVLVQ